MDCSCECTPWSVCRTSGHFLRAGSKLYQKTQSGEKSWSSLENRPCATLSVTSAAKEPIALDSPALFISSPHSFRGRRRTAITAGMAFIYATLHDVILDMQEERRLSIHTKNTHVRKIELARCFLELGKRRLHRVADGEL